MREEAGGRVDLQKTFERPTWAAELAPEGFEPADWKYKGLWIEFKAENITEPETQSLCELQGPNKVRFEVDCDVEGQSTDKVQWAGPGDDFCNPVFTASHRGGCSWNSQK